MIDVESTRKLAYLVAAAGLLWLPAVPASADTLSECREEAKLYGVSPEQFDDYIDGCVMSRGGNTPAADEGMDGMPADTVQQDGEVIGEVIEVDANAAQ